jgi:predicted secreted Zn-dependent protease
MALLVAALPGPRAAVAEVQVVQAIDYYDITGTTAQEIRANMDRIGPTWTVDGKRYDSAVGWAIVPEYRFGPTGRGCMMKAVTVKVRIIATEPRLNPNAPPALQRAFATFFAKLQEYDKHRATIVLEAAKRIDDGIMGLPPQPNCLELKPLANHLADNVERDLGRLMHDYLRRTDAGRQLGAVFPPADTKPVRRLPRRRAARAPMRQRRTHRRRSPRRNAATPADRASSSPVMASQ